MVRKVGIDKKHALAVVKNSGAITPEWKGKELTLDLFRDICERIASGESPVEACTALGVSPQGLFRFKYNNRDNEEIKRAFDEAFTAKGGVYIAKAEEVIAGLMEGKYDKDVAQVAFKAYMKLAEVADKRFSSKPVVVEDRRSITINQIDSEKILELNKLITG